MGENIHAGAPAEQWIAQTHYNSMPFAGKTDIQIMKLHSRGVHPPRLDFPPLSDEAWELIRSCWVREAPKRPRIEVITEKMVAIVHDSQSRVKRHECATCHKR